MKKIWLSTLIGAAIATLVISLSLPFSSQAQGEALIRIIGPDGKMGYIDPQGVVIVTPEFEAVQEFTEGLGTVLTGRK